MNKEQQIKQMMLDVPQKIVAYDGNPAGQHLYGEQRQQIAETLYNAGYRKTFTSDFASDTQKAYKEGYEKGIEETKAEIEILKIQNKNLGIAFDRLEAENERLTERLKQVLLSIDTVKEMNAMCNIDDQRKQAVKEFSEKLIKLVFDYLDVENAEQAEQLSLIDSTLTYDVILHAIDKLIKEEN